MTEKNEPQHLFTHGQKKTWWDEGYWCNEPDFWEFEHNGIACKILRIIGPDGEKHVFGGHLCGYVKLPFDSLNKKELQEIYIVHGGITFNEKYEDGSCWIGFDCAHSNDLVPSMREINKSIDESIKKTHPNLDFSKMKFFNRTYKNWDYVLSEVKDLADQVKERSKRSN